jgi:ribose transport system substrate-binding protein
MKNRRAALIMLASATLALTAACSSTDASSTASGNTTAGAGSTITGSGSTSAGSLAGLPTIEQLATGNATLPPTTGPAPAKDKNIWYISCGAASPSCLDKANEAKKAGALLGWNVTIADGALGDPAILDAAVRTGIAAKPDAIVQDGIGCSADAQSLKEAKDAGIPVLGLETLDCADTGGENLFTIPWIANATEANNTDYRSAFGKYAAQYLIAATGGKAKIIANLGVESQPQEWLLTQAFNAEMAKCSGCEIVETVNFDEKELVSNGPWISAFQAALVKHPDATAIFMPWDFMATSLGGQQAIAEAGLQNVVTVGGIGDTDSATLIRDGKWTANGAVRDSHFVAWSAIDTLNRHFNGQPSVAEGVGFTIIDKDHNLPAPGGLYATALDYQAAYQKAWAVS